MNLQACDWPANVRELQNVIERTMISSRCGSEKLDLALPQNSAGSSPKSLSKKKTETSDEVIPEDEMRLREKANIEAALNQTDWKIYGSGGAAELLGIKPTTLLSRLKKMGIEKVGSNG